MILTFRISYCAIIIGIPHISINSVGSITRKNGNTLILSFDPGNYYRVVWKYFYIIVGPQELLLDDIEIFLYYRGTAGIIIRMYGNIPILFGTIGIITRWPVNISYVIMGPWELFLQVWERITKSCQTTSVIITLVCGTLLT